MAVEHELIRRREGLLRSLASPHREAAELAETGLADWGASLPADDQDFVEAGFPDNRRLGVRSRPQGRFCLGDPAKPLPGIDGLERTQSPRKERRSGCRRSQLQKRAPVEREG